MNRLEKEISPYLLDHASNPIDWHPWDDFALLKAKTENKPIFLSIGYSSCHWCHVMAHETFTNLEVASIINKHFVSIKVDREERPDIDKIYMDALVSMTGQGGWPLSAFLTPEGYPFYMGTYFPLRPRHGLPGFVDILNHIARSYEKHSLEIIEQSQKMTQNLRNMDVTHLSVATQDKFVMASVLENLFKNFDETNGGWGFQPKFPNALLLLFLLENQLYNQAHIQAKVNFTLDQMAKGGMYDLVRGGFHRYSTDEKWLIPHFEKMLYDNALLALAYINSFQLSKNLNHKVIAESTINFIKNELLSAAEGFWSSLDADVEEIEGEYYVWSEEELYKNFSSDENDEIKNVFSFDESVKFENHFILRLKNNQHGTYKFDKFREIQESRIRPKTDDKLLVDWNALAITTFSKSALYFQIENNKEISIRVMNFILSNLYLKSRLFHSFRKGILGKKGLLSDYSYLINALVDIFLIDPKKRWLEEAYKLCDEMVDLFWDGSQFFDTGNDDSNLIIRPQTIEDSVTPSGWSMAILAIQRLNIFRNHEKFSEVVIRSIEILKKFILKNPLYFPVWLKILSNSQRPPESVIFIKSEKLTKNSEFEQQIIRHITPDTIFLSLAENDPIIDQLDLLKGKITIEHKNTAYYCYEYTCTQPMTTIEEFISEYKNKN